MIYIILRVGCALTFIGHGYFVFMQKPQWVFYLQSVGFNYSSDLELMLYIGVLDFLVALFLLFKPVRIVLIWAFIWTLATAFVRPYSGESWFEFVERGSNFAIPFALIWIKGFPKNLKLLFQ